MAQSLVIWYLLKILKKQDIFVNCCINESWREMNKEYVVLILKVISLLIWFPKTFFCKKMVLQAPGEKWFTFFLPSFDGGYFLKHGPKPNFCWLTWNFVTKERRPCRFLWRMIHPRIPSISNAMKGRKSGIFA